MRIELVPLTPPDPALPLLVLGPSLGTTVEALWGSCARLLAGRFEIAGWELPGHGRAAAATTPFTVEDLADGVLADGVLAARPRPFHYAGDSIGGAVGLALLLRAGGQLSSATLACTGARIGTPDGWRERAAAVRAGGTSSLVEQSAKRWFGPGFADREPEAAARLLAGLAAVDAESYALVCGALAAFDVRAELSAVRRPVTLIAGRADEVTPVAGLRAIAAAVPHARLLVLDGVAHLAPVEAPAAVAEAIRAHVPTTAETFDAGMAVRREVAGDAWVDRAEAATTDFTRDFQQFITTYAWGSVWTRPGLDRRSRSMITITALVARGHHEELGMHIRAALTNGVTRDELTEVLLQAAVYCGVPDANTAFRVAQRVLDEIDEGS